MRKDIREPYRILASFSNKLEVSVSAENGRRKAPCRPELLALPVKRRGSGRRQDGDCGVGVGEPPPPPPRARDPANKAEQCCWIEVGWVPRPESRLDLSTMCPDF